MNELFLKLLAMSLDAGWLALAVMLLRFLLSKAPRRLFPALWSLVGIRLLLPKSLESDLSLIPDMYGIAAFAQTLIPAEALQGPASRMWIVWCVGATAMLLFEAVSYAHLRSKVKTAVRLTSGIYQSEHVNAPFIMGFFAPRIYIPFHMEREMLVSVIAHERSHIKRRDHWLKPAAFLLLSLYWFNPLIWVSYILLCKDIELACDECAIRNMNDSQRATYSQALLSCTANWRILTVCPLAFGSRDVKKRIHAVLSYRKPRTWVIIVAAAFVLVLVTCFMTNPKKEETVRGDDDSDISQTCVFEVAIPDGDVSDISDSEHRRSMQELERVLLGERMREQEALARTHSN